MHGHLSAAGRPQDRESLPARDRRSTIVTRKIKYSIKPEPEIEKSDPKAAFYTYSRNQPRRLRRV